MPQLIEYLDKTEQEQQSFAGSLRWHYSIMELDGVLYIDFTRHSQCDEVTAWLDSNDIKWMPRVINRIGWKHNSIQLVIPFDQTDPVYRKVAGHLENSDGSMKIPNASFYYTPLTDVMKMAFETIQKMYEEFDKLRENSNEGRRKPGGFRSR